MSEEVTPVKVTVIIESDDKMLTYTIPFAKDISLEFKDDIDRDLLPLGGPLWLSHKQKFILEMDVLKGMNDHFLTLKVEDKDVSHE